MPDSDRIVFQRYPELDERIIDVGDGFSIQIEPDLTLEVIETPGHKVDHISFSLRHQQNQADLFPGDLILGTPSVSFDDLSAYMESLHKVNKFNFKKIYLSHHTDSIVCDAAKKIDSYIKYRERSE